MTPTNNGHVTGDFRDIMTYHFRFSSFNRDGKDDDDDDDDDDVVDDGEGKRRRKHSAAKTTTITNAVDSTSMSDTTMMK